jgi:hypothetical protein
MKKLLLYTSVVASFAIIVAACNTNPVAVTPLVNEDTAGFAQFKEMKAMEAQALAFKNYQAANAPVARRAKTSESGTMSSASTNEAKVAKKKGWSKSAKYAVIGGTGGAVLGAIINKRNPVKGAVIGAVVLGGGGYIFGRSQDKKDGRF